MDETQIKFGDKIFLYGRMTDYEAIEQLGLANPEYNTVMGYITVGGYNVVAQKTDYPDACVTGFVTDTTDSLAFGTLFSRMHFVDVTHLLSRQDPFLTGTKVWMPIP